MSTPLYINGQWTAASNKAFASINPANGNTVWEAKSASEAEVDAAVMAARAALPKWSAKTLEQRLSIISLYKENLQKNSEQMALAISHETGKPLWESRTEITAMVNKVAISIEAYKQRTGVVENNQAAPRQSIRHKPHGVMAVFGPYNFPGHLPNGHIVPALIAGNTIIFKPSEITPYVAELMVQNWHDANLDAGVLNLVQGEVATGKALAAHPQIDGLLFTGSAQTGKLLHSQFGGHPEKMLALEMGGNNPLVIKDITEENLNAYVYQIIQSAFVSTGQRCTCARRLFIPDNEPLSARLIQRLIEVTSHLVIGEATQEPQPFIGPLVSAQAAINIHKAFNNIIAQGATPLLNMELMQEGTGFITPGIVDITYIMDEVKDEEYFGPILQVCRYDGLDEAIAFANNTQYGLSAGLFGGTQEDFDYFYQHIRAGIVNWNTQLTGASSMAPFGGIGASGNHRPSAFYAADYCAYPVASLAQDECVLPETLAPGITL